MKIVFATDELRKECNNQELLIKRFGPTIARLMRRRLDELFNSEVLEDLRSMPHVNIGGADWPDLAMDLQPPYRLIFRPVQTDGNGIADWKKIDSILILGLRKNDAQTP